MPVPNVEELQQKHPRYEERINRWERAGAHYKASIDELRDKQYLNRRNQSESKEQFDERVANADYTPLFSVIVAVYAGRILGAEPRTERRFQQSDGPEGLGALDEDGSLASRLWRNVDGRGTNYLTQIHQAAIKLVAKNEFWSITEGPRRVNGEVVGEPTRRIIDPTSVFDWKRSKGGTLEWCKVRSYTDARNSWRQEAAREERYHIYHPDGYEHYAIRKGANGEKIVADLMDGRDRIPYSESGDFTFYADAEARQSALPIFQVRLPMSQFVGDILAAKNGVIFNQESERDNLLRVANTPKGVWVGGAEGFWEFQKKQANENISSNLWYLDPESRNKHYFMTPPTDAANLATEVIKDKRGAFFMSGFRFYEDSVQSGAQKTATQIAQEQAPEDSFLNALATGLDEFENGSGVRLEQIQFPREPSRWGQFEVNRPKDFDPIDAEATANEIMEAMYGRAGAVPLTEDAEVDAIRKIYEARDLTFNEDDVRRKVRERQKAESDRAQTAGTTGVGPL